MASVVTTASTSYATPKTWAASEALTATLFNTYIRDQILAVKTPAYFRCYMDEAADLTTTSTTFVDTSATALSATITTGGGVMLLGFSASVASGAGSNAYRAFFDVAVDGTRIGLDDGLISHYGPYTASASFTVVTAALAAGSHTFKVQWKVSNALNTTTLYAGAGTAAADIHPTFWGVEL